MGDLKDNNDIKKKKKKKKKKNVWNQKASDISKILI